jgi:hypothetical protein
MQLNYHSTHQDQGFLSRIFIFLKRNYWLYALEVLLIVLLILPPYGLDEIRLLILIVAIILTRDFFIFRLSYKHLGGFVAKGNEVYIGIIHGSKIKKEINEWLPELDLEIKYTIGIPVLCIMKGNETLFKQYSFGVWSIQKMNEFVNSFYDYKKEQALWKMFKGQE